MCLVMLCFGFVLCGPSVLPGFEYLLSHVRDVFSYNLFKYFLMPLLPHGRYWCLPLVAEARPCPSGHQGLVKGCV